jgi:acetate kinase
MGLTPLAGLPMGTRAGDMDVGVIEYVANKYDRSISSVMEGLNKRSGMMGLSGVSSDFRDLEAAAAKGHHRSAIALRIFEYRVHKMIAEYAAAMNGVDVVVFTAGVGENAPSTRAHILEGLEFMGITCDEEKNNVRGEERIISKDGAPVTVMVIPTNEELMIAQDTLSIVEESKNK